MLTSNDVFDLEDVNDYYFKLAHMVKEQEEMVQRIDSNVEDTLFNVELGHNEILK